MNEVEVEEEPDWGRKVRKEGASPSGARDRGREKDVGVSVGVDVSVCVLSCKVVRSEAIARMPSVNVRCLGPSGAARHGTLTHMH